MPLSGRTLPVCRVTHWRGETCCAGRAIRPLRGNSDSANFTSIIQKGFLFCVKSVLSI